MNIARIARTAVFALLVTAGLAACTGDPVAPSGDDDPGSCVWIHGVLHCSS